MSSNSFLASKTSDRKEYPYINESSETLPSLQIASTSTSRSSFPILHKPFIINSTAWANLPTLQSPLIKVLNVTTSG
uniref:Uncharacterized protein n=1 Tax=Salix viminalis TaxID=40686 RepID=A0A6N2L038_SALVM